MIKTIHGLKADKTIHGLKADKTLLRNRDASSKLKEIVFLNPAVLMILLSSITTTTSTVLLRQMWKKSHQLLLLLLGPTGSRVESQFTQ